MDDWFYDDVVSEVCGFDVSTTVTLSSEHGTYRLKDVGADVFHQRPDGSVDVSIMGQVPFGFKGVFRFDPETGEVLKMPQRETADEIWAVCEALEG